jgi:hypothetical protein
MSELIAIVGESGSGKTTSIRNLNPSETFIISTTGKRPGIKGAKKKYPDFKVENGKISGNFYTTANIDNIKKMMGIINSKLTNVKILIIDDFQYLQAFEAMSRADEKGYAKFTDMAKHAYEALKSGMDMRDDLYICVLTHSENTGDNINPYFKIKTVGKMLDTVITLEGLFTYVLFTKVSTNANNEVEYKFITNSNGTCTAKSPMGLFSDLLIDNDLDYVIKSIKAYSEDK